MTSPAYEPRRLLPLAKPHDNTMLKEADPAEEEDELTLLTRRCKHGLSWWDASDLHTPLCDETHNNTFDALHDLLEGHDLC